MANLKRIPTWLLVEELISREDVSYSKGLNSIAITVKDIEKPSKDEKEGSK